MIRIRRIPLLGALPPRFATLNGHSQFVVQPPPGATILAVSYVDTPDAAGLIARFAKLALGTV